MRSKIVRLWRSNKCSRLQALQDVTGHTRQQGNTVPPARARVALKREIACTTRKAEPLGCTFSKVCHVCPLSLPHHRESSTRASREGKTVWTFLLNAMAASSTDDRPNWRSYLSPHSCPRSLPRIFVPARRNRCASSFVAPAFASPLLPFGMGTSGTHSPNG